MRIDAIIVRVYVDESVIAPGKIASIVILFIVHNGLTSLYHFILHIHDTTTGPFVYWSIIRSYWTVSKHFIRIGCFRYVPPANILIE